MKAKIDQLILVGLLSVVLLGACGDSTATVASPPSAVTSSAATTAAPTGNLAATTAAPTSPTVSECGAQPCQTISPVTTSKAAQATTPGQTTLATSPATITKANGARVTMTVELARTEKEQEIGLMGRNSVPDGQGMLFIFREAGRIGFWMKDTPLALSIAFIDPKGKIVDIQDMQPFSLDTHAPGKDYISALEVSQGYFARVGVRPGDSFVLT